MGNPKAEGTFLRLYLRSTVDWKLAFTRGNMYSLDWPGLGKSFQTHKQRMHKSRHGGWVGRENEEGEEE